ncbi:MAG: hypothetical protein GKS05_03530 [Nitrospirales bacterium]|nr:hypothetical protein [Nitrospirales bacterium]
MADISQQTRAQLDRQPWDEHVQRLALYAFRKCARLYWHGMRNGSQPSGQEAEDFAMKAIKKVYSGERQWNYNADPDLFHYLKSVVDSLISASVSGWDNRHLRILSLILDPEEGQDTNETAEVLAHDAPRPDHLLEEAEKTRLSLELCQGFRDFLCDEPTLQQVVSYILDDVTKPGDIAQLLGVSSNHMTNLRKKLQRRWKEFMTTAYLESPI